MDGLRFKTTGYSFEGLGFEFYTPYNTVYSGL